MVMRGSLDGLSPIDNCLGGARRLLKKKIIVKIFYLYTALPWGELCIVCIVNSYCY